MVSVVVVVVVGGVQEGTGAAGQARASAVSNIPLHALGHG